MHVSAALAAFIFGFLSVLVLVRLGRRPGARGREERILIVIGWVLVGVAIGAAGLLLLSAALG